MNFLFDRFHRTLLTAPVLITWTGVLQLLHFWTMFQGSWEMKNICWANIRMSRYRADKTLWESFKNDLSTFLIGQKAISTILGKWAHIIINIFRDKNWRRSNHWLDWALHQITDNICFQSCFAPEKCWRFLCSTKNEMLIFSTSQDCSCSWLVNDEKNFSFPASS